MGKNLSLLKPTKVKKCVLRLSFVVHGPVYGRFMGFYVNRFLSLGPWTTKERRKTHFK